MPAGSADPPPVRRDVLDPLDLLRRDGVVLSDAAEAVPLTGGVSFARSERMAKWNEVLRIERALGARARFAGASRSMGNVNYLGMGPNGGPSP